MFKGGMAMNGMQGMLKKVQKMQSEMTRLQDELKEREVEGTAGGEAVKAVVNGNKNLQPDPVSGCSGSGRRGNAPGPDRHRRQ